MSLGNFVVPKNFWPLKNKKCWELCLDTPKDWQVLHFSRQFFRNFVKMFNYLWWWLMIDFSVKMVELTILRWVTSDAQVSYHWWEAFSMAQRKETSEGLPPNNGCSIVTYPSNNLGIKGNIWVRSSQQF